MIIDLTPNWWNEIRALPLPVVVQDQLVATVSSHLTCTIPPSVTEHCIKELVKANIEAITLADPEYDVAYQYEVAVYKPHDTQRHRQFTYLRKTYLAGDNIALK